MRVWPAPLIAAYPVHALAGPIDFGPSFILTVLIGVAFYALYLIVPLAGIWLWRKGHKAWVGLLSLLWITGAVFVPFADYQRAKLQAKAHWDLRVMPDALELAGKSFLSDDTIRTPHDAIFGFNDPNEMYGLYNGKESLAALATGPIDLGTLRFFEHVSAPGRYKDRRTVEVPAGTRIAPDYLMLSGFYGRGRYLLDVLQHPNGAGFPSDFSAQFAIVEVADPAAFDLRAAQVAMLVPYTSESYYRAPFNPFVRTVHYHIPYSDRMRLLIDYFCKGLDEDARDDCRRDI